MNLTEFITDTQEILQDDGNVLTTGEIQTYVQDAVEVFQSRFPEEAVESYTGANNQYWFDLPTGWSQDLSKIIYVEYPVSDTNEDIKPLSAKNYGVLVYTGTTKRLRFRSFQPPAGKEFRVHYTRAHTVTTGSSTVPTIHDMGIRNLAGAKCCLALARHYSQHTDPSISAIGVSFKQKADYWRARHNELMLMWEQHVTRFDVPEIHEATYAYSEQIDSVYEVQY